MAKTKGQPVIAFVWDFTVHPLDLYGWADGLQAALTWLAKKYDWYVKVIASDKTEEIYQQIEELSPDVIVGWGSLDRPSFAGIKEFGKPTALCFAGGPTSHPQLDNFDLVFAENQVYKEAFEKQGVNVHIAFGTNDDLFYPMDLKKKFVGIYPAAFAKWKRHDLFAKATGKDGLALGKILDHETECFQVCIDNGVTVMPQVPYEVLPFLYNQSIYCVITANTHGGSQRAVLEAMACNVWPIVMKDSEKCAEYVLESGFGSVVEPTVEAIAAEVKNATAKRLSNKDGGRRFIESKYSAEKYADKLYEQISLLL